MHPIEIAIATYPQGISFDQEIRLLKPALLYADHVTLYSPLAALLISTRSFGDMSEAERVALLREVLPTVAEATGEQDPTAAFDLYDALTRKRKPSRHEIKQIYSMKRMLAQLAENVVGVVDGMLETAGAREIVPAADAGLLTIDTVLREEAVDDAFSEAFADRLEELLLAGDAYPLLDDGVTDLARAHLDEGIWEIGASAKRRGKQVTAAAQFMEHMPAFPAASIAEVLDIRETLRSPLVRFRGAMVEIERIVDSAAHEEEFASEVEEVFVEKIAPALQEIEEAVADDRYLRQLTGALVSDAKTYATGCVALCMAHFAAMPNLLAASTAVGASLGAAALQAQWRKKEGQEAAERQQMFFLYKLDQLLEPRRSARVSGPALRAG